jgi:hypothetical protein
MKDALACLLGMLSLGFFLGQKSDLRTENGITMVRNARDPTPQNGVSLNPMLTEDLRLGEGEAAGDSAFAAVASVLVDAEENIIVLDPKDMGLKIFDKTGRFLRRFGNKGQGPEEIQTPQGMMLSEGKDILILDSGNNRLAFYAKEGLVLKRIPLKKNHPYSPVLDSRGHIYGTTLSFGEEVRQNLIELNPNLSPVTTIASLKMPPENKIPPPELMERFVFQIGLGDDFIWAVNTTYELNVTNSYGKTYKKIRRDAAPEKVTLASLVKELRKRYPHKPVPDSLDIPKHYPGVFPFFSSFICDDEGRLFVRTYENFGSGRIRYDVFNREGVYIARLEHPENERITAIRNGKAYAAVEESEAGHPAVKRYRIEWRKVERAF